jgi:site-specific DNA-cytosine methylase
MISFMRVSEFFGFGDFLLSAKIAKQTPVFACPLDDQAKEVIEANFKVPVHVGLENLWPPSIPRTDLVCLRMVEEAASAFKIILALDPRAIVLEKRKGDHPEDVVKQFMDAGYDKSEETYSATEFGLPQDTKRTYLVLTKKNPMAFSSRFPFPDATSKSTPTFGLFMEKNADPSLVIQKLPKDSKIISPEEQLQAFNERILVNDVNGPRRISPIEARRISGIPDSFNMPIPTAKVYRLVSQSVWIPVCTEIIKEISEWLK